MLTVITATSPIIRSYPAPLSFSFLVTGAGFIIICHTYKNGFPDQPVTLPNGRLVCHDHLAEICGYCCVDYRYMINDDSGEYDSGSPDGDTVEDGHTVSPIDALRGSAAKFDPQTDRRITRTPWKTDRVSFSQLRTVDCTKCALTWLSEYEGWSFGESSRSIFVFVDGACPFNGTPQAYAGVGVYFHPDSVYNLSAALSLDGGRPPTSQNAEVRAAVYALQIVRTRSMLDHPNIFRLNVHCDPHHSKYTDRRDLFRIIITSDSSYLVERMYSHLEKWRWSNQDGAYINQNSGKLIQNSSAIRALVKEVEALADLGIEIVYYHVLREDNSDADRLARIGAESARKDKILA